LRRWAAALVPAGQNALLAYILAPLINSFLDSLSLVGVPRFYDALGRSFVIGFWRSVVFSVAVLWLAGVLQRRGVHLKL
jgi:hypothetical protein